METYSNAALSNEMHVLQRRQAKQSHRMMMMANAFNDIIEIVNSLSEWADGQSTHKWKVNAADGQKVMVKMTFIAKKLDYLEMGEAT